MVSSEPVIVEVSFEDSVKMLGVKTEGFGTCAARLRPDGTMYGDGHGALFTRDGEMIRWKGSGRGTFTEKGGVSYRGILYYRTESKKLARLNQAPGVFEYEVDSEGKTHMKVWEWN